MSKEEMGVTGFSPGRPNAQLSTLLMPLLMAQGARLRAERLEREKQADKELSERVSRSIVQKMEEAHKAARKRWSTSEEIWELLLIVYNARLEFLAWSLLLFGILCAIIPGTIILGAGPQIGSIVFTIGWAILKFEQPDCLDSPRKLKGDARIAAAAIIGLALISVSSLLMVLPQQSRHS